MVKVLVKKLDSKVKLPSYKTKGSSGMDLMAFINNPIKVFPNTSVLIPTGLSIAIPEDVEIQIRPRSGLAAKSNIGILNTIAIILTTALVGIFLVRRQGIKLLFDAQKNLSQGVMPTEEIKGGIFLLVSGLLLITPGFFTDCIGFSVFLKPVQNFIAIQAKKYFNSRIHY